MGAYQIMVKDENIKPGLEVSHDDLPASAAPELSALLKFWRSHKDRAGIPSRLVMEPFQLVAWLGHLSIYEALDGGRDFRNRLEGTSVVTLTGEDWTGRMASAVDQRFGSSLVPAMRIVIATGEVAIHTMKLYQDGYKDVTRLLLPVRSRPDGPIDQVFLALYVDSKRAEK